jgi:hypothetical protein
MLKRFRQAASAAPPTTPPPQPAAPQPVPMVDPQLSQADKVRILHISWKWTKQHRWNKCRKKN